MVDSGQREVLYFSHPCSRAHDPGALAPGHPDSPARILAIEAALEADGWVGCRRVEAPAASEDELALVHTNAHIALVRRLCAGGGGQLDADTYVGEPSYRAALRAAGGACAMVRALLTGKADRGFCGLRPSGHHAEPDRAMGFCLFNNIAIAAEFAVREFGLERVFILDWDVHHGNGTAEIFRHRPEVLYASIHQSDLYPGTGQLHDAGSGPGLGYTINLPVPRRSTDEVWLSMLEHVIIPAAIDFNPQLVLISAGFDAHRWDPLGRCLLEADSFARMTCHVRGLATRSHAPIGAVLEGGYHPPALADSVRAMINALGGQGGAESIAPYPLLTSRAAAQVAHFWERLP